MDIEVGVYGANVLKSFALSDKKMVNAWFFNSKNCPF